MKYNKRNWRLKYFSTRVTCLAKILEVYKCLFCLLEKYLFLKSKVFGQVLYEKIYDFLAAFKSKISYFHLFCFKRNTSETLLRSLMKY